MELLSNNPDYTERDTVNELKMSSLLKNSFATVPTVGMRLAPEIILLELYREVFFKNKSNSRTIKYLDPDSGEYSKHEKIVLDALRGRERKRTKSMQAKPFYAPAYPSLARHAWPRESEAGVVNALLLKGPIATHLWCGVINEEKKELHEELKNELFTALVGNNSSYFDTNNLDILSVALKDVSFEIDEELATRNIESKTGEANVVMDISSDELSQRIFYDLLAICKLEKKVPRMQWLEMFMTFLRFAMPMWLLSQMRITIMLHGWLIDTIDSGKSIDQETIKKGISQRNLELLHPSMTATSEIFDATKTYIKKRVELNCILYDLTDIREKEMSKERLVIKENGSSKDLSISQLLNIAKGAADDLKSLSPCQTYGDSVSRNTEKYSAYRDPLKSGQGKNIDEFFRVLIKDVKGDESGGNLLNPFFEGNKKTGFSVFPGQLLMKTITVLTNHRKINKKGGLKGGGQMILGDIEKHFQEYGIDFSLAADARPYFIETLKNMGLLFGSPDAGSNVAVKSPYYL